MATLHQLRVELDDRPGVLARAAALLAADGVNILDIAVHEIDGPTVVDELVVDAPDGWDLAASRERLDAVGVHLLSSGLVHGRADPVVTTLGHVHELVLAPPGDLDALARLVGRVAGTSRACVLPAERARQVSAGRAALSRGTPVVQRTADLPLAVAAGQQLRWLVAVPDGAPAELVAFATRPLSLRPTATEVARTAALVRLHRALRPAGAALPSSA